MNIKTRKQAMIDGDNIYFTGKPCKHGHMNYRYVQSGACYDCINSTRRNGESATAIARRDRLSNYVDKSEMKSELVLAKFRVFDDHYEAFLATVWAFTLVRYAEVGDADIESHTPPSHRTGGTSMYGVNCHPADVEQIRIIANAMLNEGSVNGREAYVKIHGAEIAKVKVAPVPDWARISKPGDFDYKGD